MFATFMEVLDTTVVNVSLPHIAGNLSATIDESTWVLTSYLVANAIVLPMTGWLASDVRPQAAADDVGRPASRSRRCCAASRRTCRCSSSFRLLQGATGGAMQPLSQAVLLEAFPPHERGKAMGFWGLGIVVAPILGPVLGGWLTDTYSWRWVFYINLPVGIASLVMTKLYVFDPPYLRQETQRDRLLGHRPAGGRGSARCRSRSTSDRSTTGSRRRSSPSLVVMSAVGARRVPRARVDRRRAGRRSARLQGAHATAPACS